jgi:DNA-binding beta-propeller fold protein YncE
MIRRLAASLTLSAALIAGVSRSDGRPILYISDAADGKVIRDVLDKGAGKPGTQTVFATLAMPTGLAFDAKGNLFVASQNGNTVTKFAPDGTPTAFLDKTKGVMGPQGLAFDKAGNLYVANSDSKVREYDPTGKLVQTIATDPSPFGLTFDAKGNLFVATLLRDRIDEFTFGKDGVKKTVFTTTKGNGPFGVAVDKAGNVDVSNFSVNTVDVLNPATGKFSPFIDNTNGLNRPQGLAIDAQGNLYVANQGGGNGDVLEFSKAGKLLGPVTKNLKTPIYIAISVPEPTTVALLGSGLLGLLGYSARRGARRAG